MRTTTAHKPGRMLPHKPWWLMPRYAVAQPVIRSVAFLVGMAVAAGVAHLLHVGPMAIAAAAMLTCSGVTYGLGAARRHVLDRINGSPHDQLERVFREIEDQAIARFCAETTTPLRAVDGLLTAVIPADPATPGHHSARGGAA